MELFLLQKIPLFLRNGSIQNVNSICIDVMRVHITLQCHIFLLIDKKIAHKNKI